MATEITINDLNSSQEPYTTYNELAMLLRSLAYGVVDKDLTAPPGGETDETLYIPAATATGAWAGLEGKLVWIKDTAWYYYTPLEGTTVRVRDEDKFYRYDGSAWASITETTTATIGDVAGGDYLQVEADGTIELNGDATVWKDINMSAAQVISPSVSYPDIDEFVDEGGSDTGVETLAFAPGESVSGQFEMQHDYKEDSDFTPHVHFQIIAAPTGTDKVKWQLDYTIARTGETLDAVTAITTEVDVDTQYQFYRVDFAAITGTGVDIGDQFIFKLSRIAASADEFAGDALIATFGIHYEIDTIGSRTVSAK